MNRRRSAELCLLVLLFGCVLASNPVCITGDGGSARTPNALSVNEVSTLAIRKKNTKHTAAWNSVEAESKLCPSVGALGTCCFNCMEAFQIVSGKEKQICQCSGEGYQFRFYPPSGRGFENQPYTCYPNSLLPSDDSVDQIINVCRKEGGCTCTPVDKVAVQTFKNYPPTGPFASDLRKNDIISFKTDLERKVRQIHSQTSKSLQPSPKEVVQIILQSYEYFLALYEVKNPGDEHYKDILQKQQVLDSLKKETHIKWINVNGIRKNEDATEVLRVLNLHFDTLISECYRIRAFIQNTKRGIPSPGYIGKKKKIMDSLIPIKALNDPFTQGIVQVANLITKEWNAKSMYAKLQMFRAADSISYKLLLARKKLKQLMSFTAEKFFKFLKLQDIGGRHVSLIDFLKNGNKVNVNWLQVAKKNVGKALLGNQKKIFDLQGKATKLLKNKLFKQLSKKRMNRHFNRANRHLKRSSRKSIHKIGRKLKKSAKKVAKSARKIARKSTSRTSSRSAPRSSSSKSLPKLIAKKKK